MQWQSSAPGSVMLLGEHAVLADYPAVAMAVDQRITLDFSLRSDGQIHIYSQLAEHHTQWHDLEPHPQLSFLMTGLAQYQHLQLPGLDVHIHSQINPTFGLGSSAALVAALVKGMEAITTTGDIWSHFQQGLKIIRLVQKRGSGSDLAASLAGGVCALYPQEKRLESLMLDAEFSLAYVGYKTPTPEVIRWVNERWCHEPTALVSFYENMGRVTQEGIAAIKNADIPGLAKAMNDYQSWMQQLGVNNQDLQQLIDAFHAQGAKGVKISGSGLGDCVLALGHYVLAQSLPFAISPLGALWTRQHS